MLDKLYTALLFLVHMHGVMLFNKGSLGVKDLKAAPHFSFHAWEAPRCWFCG